MSSAGLCDRRRRRGVKFSVTLWKSVLRACLVTMLTLLTLSNRQPAGRHGHCRVHLFVGRRGQAGGRRDLHAGLSDDPGLCVWMAVIYVCINLITDLSYRFLDPRIRPGRWQRMTGSVTVRHQKVRKPHRSTSWPAAHAGGGLAACRCFSSSGSAPRTPTRRCSPRWSRPARRIRRHGPLGARSAFPHPDRPADQRAVLAGSGGGHCRGRHGRRRAERLLWRLGGQPADADRRRLSGVSGLVLGLAVAALLGGGLHNAMLALAVVSWPKYARVARSQTLALLRTDHMAAARLAGGSTPQLILRHIRPTARGRCLSPRCWISEP